MEFNNLPAMTNPYSTTIYSPTAARIAASFRCSGMTPPRHQESSILDRLRMAPFAGRSQNLCLKQCRRLALNDAPHFGR